MFSFAIEKSRSDESRENRLMVYLSVEVIDCERSQVEKKTWFGRDLRELHSAQSTCGFFFFSLFNHAGLYFLLSLSLSAQTFLSSLSLVRPSKPRSFLYRRRYCCRNINLRTEK